jgi:hypothetical protein
MSYTQADEEGCGELLQKPDYPDLAHVNLVGTSFSTAVPLPPGGKDGDPFPFQFNNVPAGDYDVHMSATIAYCKEYKRNNPAAVSNPNAKPQLVVHERALAVLSSTLTARVTPGQTVELIPGQMADLFHAISPPTWLDGETLHYSFQTGNSQGVTSSDLWSAPLNGTPVQLTDSLLTAAQPFPKVRNPDASPVTRRIAAISDGLGSGVFVSESANVANTALPVTDPLEISFATFYELFVADDNPAWSPDGLSHIAFIRQHSPSNAPLPLPAVDTNAAANSLTGGILGDLWIQTVSTGVDEGTQLNLAKGEGFFGRPAWSPDGSQIAVSYTPDNFKTVNVRIVNVADGSAFDLTTDGRSALPTWTGQAQAADFPANVGFLPPAKPSSAQGDLTGDGKVNVSDAILGLNIAVGLRTATPAQIQTADFNGDGKLTVSDVVKMLRLAVGLT